MKKVICAAMLIVFVYSCRKDAVVKEDSSTYLHSVLLRLRDSLGTGDFGRLDTGRAVLTDPGGRRVYTLRIPFVGKSVGEDFVLLRTDSVGNLLKGQVVHLESSGVEGARFSGRIRLQSLGGRVILNSAVEDGFISVLHEKGNRLVETSGVKAVTLEPAPGADWLPEVLVVGYTGGGASTSYISLDGLLGVTSGDILAGGGSDSGGSDEGSEGGDGGGTEGSGGGAPGAVAVYSPVEPVVSQGGGMGGLRVIQGIEVEREYVYDLPAVDVRKLFNCFDLVPSEGAVYTVQLCVDLPVNSSPNMSMNFSGGVNAGHTFLVISKSGGGESVTQAFGFYPGEEPSAWNPFSSLPSAIKDNGNKEINASIGMSINADQFEAIKAMSINLSSKSYELDKFNCTDYALTVFNATRAVPITMDPYILRQGGITVGNGVSSAPVTVVIASSPQKLYDKLATMKTGGSTEAANINLDLSHNTKAPISHGACN
ncbi:MAG: hypothetical protein JST68_26990 [Bacteroidetes bacterium]|nr:hypothetical protein [Bacteroidota bacterium]